MRVGLHFIGSALLLAYSVFGGVALAADPDPVEVLNKAEGIRNPRVSYMAKILLTDKVGDPKGSEERLYQIAVKDGSMTLVTYLKPEVDKGTKVLMSGENMWVALPSSAKPIKVAPKQKLVGNASYGDIARLNYDENYNPKFLRFDAHEGKEAIVLDLAAKEGRPVTYDRVEYWIEKASHRPIKAFYMTMSGKILREGFFENYQDVMGVKRPLRMILVDRLNAKSRTHLDLSDMKAATLPLTMFDQKNLK